MLRRAMVCCLVLLSGFSMVSAVTAGSFFPLTVDERVEEFEFLYTVVAENFPFLAVKERISGRSWLDRRAEFRRRLKEAHSPREYYRALSEVVGALGNAHTHVLPPDGEQEQSVSPAFETRYQAGSYWITWVHPDLRPKLPLLGEVVAVGGVPVDTYVLEHDRPGQLMWDWRRDQAYAWALPYPAADSIELMLRVDGQERHVAVPAVMPLVERQEYANLETAVLVPDMAAYLRVRSFSQEHLGRDRAQLRSFFEEIAGYPYLVIDIRGNPGGTTAYWRRLLVEPLIDRPLYVTHYIAARDGDVARRYLRKRLGAGYYMLQIGRQADERWSQQVPELLTEAFGEPLLFPMIARPVRSSVSVGQVILLVDDRVYSSAEAMAAFAKASGWAVLVGTQTGGDGIGLDPFYVALPHSGLVVRMSGLLGLDPEGWANEERPTQPDLWVDYAVEDLPNVHSIDGGEPWDAMLHTVVDRITQEQLPEPRGESPSFMEWLAEMGSQYMLLDAYGLPRWLPPDKGRPGVGPWQIADVSVAGYDRTDPAWVSEVAEAVIGGPGDWVSLEDIRRLERQLNLYGAHRTVSVALREAHLTDHTAVRAGVVGCGAVDVIIHVLDGHPLGLSPPRTTARLVEDLAGSEISVRAANVRGQGVNFGAVWGLDASARRQVSVDFPWAGPSAARWAAEVRELETDGFSGQRTSLSLEQRSMLSSEWMLQLQQGWVHHVPGSSASGHSALVGAASLVRWPDRTDSEPVWGGTWSVQLTAGARLLLEDVQLLPLAAGTASYTYPAAAETQVVLTGEGGWSAPETLPEFYWGSEPQVFSTSPVFSRAFVRGEVELRHRLSAWWSASGYGQWTAAAAGPSSKWGVGAELRLTTPLGLEAFIRGGRQLNGDETAVTWGIRSSL